TCRPTSWTLLLPMYSSAHSITAPRTSSHAGSPASATAVAAPWWTIYRRVYRRPGLCFYRCIPRLIRLRRRGRARTLGRRPARPPSRRRGGRSIGVSTDVLDFASTDVFLGSFDYGAEDELARWVAGQRDRRRGAVVDDLSAS